MLTVPSFKEVWRGKRGMRAGIRSCVNAKCVVSALTLIYSAIDALAALARESDTTTKREFVAWVEAHLIPELDVHLTALDLYGARCRVVHTYGPTSDLSRRGRAQMLVYKWRHGHRPDDPILAEYAREATVIGIESLVESLERAVIRFELRIAKDPVLRARVEQNVKSLLCYKPWGSVVINIAA